MVGAACLQCPLPLLAFPLGPQGPSSLWTCQRSLFPLHSHLLLGYTTSPPRACRTQGPSTNIQVFLGFDNDLTFIVQVKKGFAFPTVPLPRSYYPGYVGVWLEHTLTPGATWGWRH